MVDSKVYMFEVGWRDDVAEMTRRFSLSYFVRNDGSPNEVSLYNIKTRKTFLKRGNYGDYRLDEFFKGGKVTVCARLLEILGYQNKEAKEYFESRASGHMVCVIPSSHTAETGRVLHAAAQKGFLITNLRTAYEPAGGASVYAELMGSDSAEEFSRSLASMLGEGVVDVRAPSEATDRVFSAKGETTATLDSCSVCVIKPHAVKEGNAGAIISEIFDAGLGISAMRLLNMERSEAEDFSEVYRTVLPPNEYTGMVAQLASGPCIAIEVRGDYDTVGRLRALCGPIDVEIAQALRPHTIRAKYGKKDKRELNAVHCTDLPDDGVLESHYFFETLNQ